MKALEENLKYSFKDKALLLNAVTHSSYANEARNGIVSNERLEFLGDSVLSIIVAEYLFTNFKNIPEGELTKLRAATVCEKSLAGFARKLELGKYLLLGKGENLTGGRERPSIQADAFEAVIAAIYLDGGMDAARNFVLKYIDEAIRQHQSIRDYKTMLQEVVQRNPGEIIEYVLTGETGPDHDKQFVCAVSVNGKKLAEGSGRGKKAAEQNAAKKAIVLL
jgi:ribonuclease-3